MFIEVTFSVQLFNIYRMEDLLTFYVWIQMYSERCDRAGSFVVRPSNSLRRILHTHVAHPRVAAVGAVRVWHEIWCVIVLLSPIVCCVVIVYVLLQA